jgi:hypothetical protein
VPSGFGFGVLAGIVPEPATEDGSVQMDATATSGVGDAHGAADTAMVAHRQMHVHAVTIAQNAVLVFSFVLGDGPAVASEILGTRGVLGRAHIEGSFMATLRCRTTTRRAWH